MGKPCKERMWRFKVCTSHTSSVLTATSSAPDTFQTRSISAMEGQAWASKAQESGGVAEGAGNELGSVPCGGALEGAEIKLSSTAAREASVHEFCRFFSGLL